ncbi:hypothetical protein EST38_g9734 [Candolleomyces aberdarensis]|uniref:Uncharacterized protein n=1 Tax=Candolleomyces aberdarensis TaxID=2316362 RepID=A0A4Q2D969_9AGAR|nr:hypothetical protein EST38_g9734 [Candolleomyces aberdarensis]
MIWPQAGRPFVFRALFSSKQNMQGNAQARVTAEEKAALLQGYLLKKEALEAKLARLIQEVEQVEQEITETQSQYGKLFNSESILVKLPNEMLSMIFHLVQQANRINDMPQNPIAEVVISHVCSHWRSLALSLPSLWSVFRYEGQGSPRVPLDRFEAYLERSQKHPLDLWFCFTDIGEGWPEQLDMLNLIPPHLDHCRRLYILSDRDCPLDDLCCDLTEVSAPMLEVFAMCPDKNLPLIPMDTEPSRWNPNLFSLGAPVLKYVRLDGTSVLNIHPPLDSIAHLRLEERQECSLDSIEFNASTLDYIFSLPKLQTLSIFGSFFEIDVEGYQQQTATIEARSLKHFRCGNSLLGPVHLYFLAHVSAPVLETITFHKLHFSHEGFDIQEARHTYIYPSLKSLTLLDLDGPHLNFHEHDPMIIRQVMTLTRNIKTLTFSHITLAHQPSQLLLRMIEVGGQESVWENLEHMVVLDLGLPPATYLRLVNEWPKPQNIHLPQSFVANIAPQFPHTSSVTLRSIESPHQLSPPYWPPGFDWMDNEEDPFHPDMRTTVFAG